MPLNPNLARLGSNLFFISPISNFFRKEFSLTIRLYFRNRYFESQKVQDLKCWNFETILAKIF